MRLLAISLARKHTGIGNLADFIALNKNCIPVKYQQVKPADVYWGEMPGKYQDMRILVQ